MKSSDNFAYMSNGLAGEVGELLGKVGKYIRKGWLRIDDNGIVWTKETPMSSSIMLTEELQKELGDVLWFVAGMARCLGYKLNGVATSNLQKLSSRQKRGVIDGDGDNR